MGIIHRSSHVGNFCLMPTKLVNLNGLIAYFEFVDIVHTVVAYSSFSIGFLNKY